MTESERKETMRAVPILAGFLGTLLEDASLEYIPERADNPNGATDDTIYTCPAVTFQAAADICRAFLAVEGVPAMLTYVWGQECHDHAGSDLYLTCAGHGAGFWDGDWQPYGDELTAAAHSICLYLETYVGDDGHVYIYWRWA